jgi:hypothetical protein
MPGTPRQPAELRQSRHRKASLEHAPTVEIVAPEPPEGLLPRVEAAWYRFWASDLAPFVRPTDLGALERLFIDIDEWHRTRAAFYKDPPPKPVQRKDEGHNDYQIRLGEWRIAAQSIGRLIRSDKGLRLNPLLTHMRALERSIATLEDRFGMSLRSRQELGLNRMRALTLAEHNAQGSHDDKDEDDEGPPGDDDPRAALHLAR